MERGDRELLRSAAETLRAVGCLVADGESDLDLNRLEQLRIARNTALRDLPPDTPDFEEVVHGAFHARTVAIAVRAAGADTLVATRRAAPEIIAEQRFRWLGIEAVADANEAEAGPDLAAPRYSSGAMPASDPCGCATAPAARAPWLPR